MEENATRAELQWLWVKQPLPADFRKAKLPKTVAETHHRGFHVAKKLRKCSCTTSAQYTFVSTALLLLKSEGHLGLESQEWLLSFLAFSLKTPCPLHPWLDAWTTFLSSVNKSSQCALRLSLIQLERSSRRHAFFISLIPKVTQLLQTMKWKFYSSAKSTKCWEVFVLKNAKTQRWDYFLRSVKAYCRIFSSGYLAHTNLTRRSHSRSN